MGVLDRLEFQPGDKLKLNEWHEFAWYWDGSDRTEHDPILLPPDTIVEVYSSGQTNWTPPYYTFELSHHIHGDITIDFDSSVAEKIFTLHERSL